MGRISRENEILNFCNISRVVFIIKGARSWGGKKKKLKMFRTTLFAGVEKRKNFIRRWLSHHPVKGKTFTLWLSLREVFSSLFLYEPPPPVFPSPLEGVGETEGLWGTSTAPFSNRVIWASRGIVYISEPESTCGTNAARILFIFFYELFAGLNVDRKFDFFRLHNRRGFISNKKRIKRNIRPLTNRYGDNIAIFSSRWGLYPIESRRKDGHLIVSFFDWKSVTGSLSNTLRMFVYSIKECRFLTILAVFGGRDRFHQYSDHILNTFHKQG